MEMEISYGNWELKELDKLICLIAFSNFWISPEYDRMYFNLNYTDWLLQKYQAFLVDSTALSSLLLRIIFT